MQDRYELYFLLYYKLLAYSVVKEFIKSGNFLWVKNRDSTLSIGIWKLRYFTLYFAQSFCFCFSCCILFSSPNFQNYSVLLSIFQYISAPAPGCSGPGSSWISLLWRNWILLILFHLLSHRGWQMTNTAREGAAWPLVWVWVAHGWLRMILPLLC